MPRHTPVNLLGAHPSVFWRSFFFPGQVGEELCLSTRPVSPCANRARSRLTYLGLPSAFFFLEKLPLTVSAPFACTKVFADLFVRGFLIRVCFLLSYYKSGLTISSACNGDMWRSFSAHPVFCCLENFWPSLFGVFPLWNE